MDGIAILSMADGHRFSSSNTNPASLLCGYMYALAMSESERKSIFKEECSSNEVLKRTRRKVEAMLGRTGNVYDLVKQLYAIEYPINPQKPLFNVFNQATRNMTNFFDWEGFNLKGMWLLLHQSLLDQKPTPGSFHVYRGVSIRFQVEVGKCVSFKQFTSTSTNKETAREFLEEASTLSACTFFDIEIDCGLKIDDYFGYGEEEILLSPNDALRVVAINRETSGLRIISLKQIGSSIF